MNKITITLVAAIAIFAGCSRPGIKGDGVVKTEDRSISDFSKIVSPELTRSNGPAANLRSTFPLARTFCR